MGESDARQGDVVDKDRAKRELRLRWERAVYQAHYAERLVELNRIESELLLLGLRPEDLGLSVLGDGTLRLPILNAESLPLHIPPTPIQTGPHPAVGPVFLSLAPTTDPVSLPPAVEPRIIVHDAHPQRGRRAAGPWEGDSREHQETDAGPIPVVEPLSLEPGRTLHPLSPGKEDAPQPPPLTVELAPRQPELPTPARPTPGLPEPSRPEKPGLTPAVAAEIKEPSPKEPSDTQLEPRDHRTTTNKTSPQKKKPTPPIDLAAFHPPQVDRQPDTAKRGADRPNLPRIANATNKTAAAAPGALAAAAVVEASADSKPNWRAKILRRNIPSMISSIGLHVFVILILAGVHLTINKAQDDVMIISQASVAEDHSQELQTIELEQVSELEVTDTPLEPVPIEAADAPALGELATSLVNAASSQPAPTPSRTKADEVGALASESRSLAAQARTDAGAEFFGVKAGGRKFVFVVDSSRSMRGGRFEAATREVARAVRRMKKDQSFYVLFYDENINQMTFAPGGPAESRPVEPSPENIESLERWMASIVLGAGAGPDKALEIAIEMLPDAIYLLSDGEFGAAAEKFLAKANVVDDPLDGPRPKVVVHTVALHNQGGADAMQRIATAYGGVYQFVPAPPKSK